MNHLNKKSLSSNNALGLRLRTARELRQIALEKVASFLNIRLEYLVAIEDGRFDLLPAGLYSKNYIEKYANFLGISEAEIKAWFKENLEVINENSNPFSQKVLQKKEFLVMPKIIKNTLLILAFLICLLYLAFYFKKIVFPPTLLVNQPDKNIKWSDNFIEIKGVTDAEAELRINGELILNNDKGQFSTTINLKKGLNNIVVKSKKKYSGEATVIRQILVE